VRMKRERKNERGVWKKEGNKNSAKKVKEREGKRREGKEEEGKGTVILLLF
jgi:hypothetical protein